MKPPVKVTDLDLSQFETNELAQFISEQQKNQVGVTYGYCSTCGGAVHRSTVRKALKNNKQPKCVFCTRAAAKRSSDTKLYMCAICRKVLHGEKARTARSQTKRGYTTSCGDPECKKATSQNHIDGLKSPLLPCGVCGKPSTRQSSRTSRYRNITPICSEECSKKHKSTRLENSRNNLRGQKREHTSSKYVGVSLHYTGTSWRVQLNLKGKRQHIGLFASELLAAQAYDQAACDIFGKDAKLNFGEPGYV